MKRRYPLKPKHNRDHNEVDVLDLRSHQPSGPSVKTCVLLQKRKHVQTMNEIKSWYEQQVRLHTQGQDLALDAPFTTLPSVGSSASVRDSHSPAKDLDKTEAELTVKLAQQQRTEAELEDTLVAGRNTVKELEATVLDRQRQLDAVQREIQKHTRWRLENWPKYADLQAKAKKYKLMHCHDANELCEQVAALQQEYQRYMQQEEVSRNETLAIQSQFLEEEEKLKQILAEKRQQKQQLLARLESERTHVVPCGDTTDCLSARSEVAGSNPTVLDMQRLRSKYVELLAHNEQLKKDLGRFSAFNSKSETEFGASVSARVPSQSFNDIGTHRPRSIGAQAAVGSQGNSASGSSGATRASSVSNTPRPRNEQAQTSTASLSKQEHVTKRTLGFVVKNSVTAEPLKKFVKKPAATKSIALVALHK